MKNFGKVRSKILPQEVETTETMVFVASNIASITEIIDDESITEYEYDYVGYTKDEYIQYITTENVKAIASLTEELQAAKILLGVE